MPQIAVEATVETLEPVEHRSSISRVIDTLREDIVSVDIAPGSKLRIASLSERYDANPGAVREALSRLVAEGLVVAEDQKGFRASPVSATFLNDIMDTRTFIEVEALRRSIERGDTDWEANLVAAAHRLSKAKQFENGSNTLSKQWRKLHRNYHFALISACGSPTLLQVQGLLYAQTERYRCLGGTLSSSGSKSRSSEHDNITSATLARNFPAASKALAQHYRKTVDLLIKSGLVA